MFDDLIYYFYIILYGSLALSIFFYAIFYWRFSYPILAVILIFFGQLNLIEIISITAIVFMFNLASSLTVELKKNRSRKLNKDQWLVLLGDALTWSLKFGWWPIALWLVLSIFSDSYYSPHNYNF